jgi:hypothetical protein
MTVTTFYGMVDILTCLWFNLMNMQSILHPETRRGRLIRSGALLLTAGAAATGAMLAPGIYHSQNRDFGCATTEVRPGGDVTEAALAARSKLNLRLGDVTMRNAIISAAQEAGSPAADGIHEIQPGQPVETCVSYNPAKDLVSLGGGWSATVTLPQQG